MLVLLISISINDLRTICILIYRANRYYLNQMMSIFNQHHNLNEHYNFLNIISMIFNYHIIMILFDDF